MNKVLGTHLKNEADQHKKILHFYAIALMHKKHHIKVSLNELNGIIDRNTRSDELLHDFVMYNFFGNILFIEETNTLMGRPWYQKFIKIIKANTVHTATPIIIASEKRNHFVT